MYLYQSSKMALYGAVPEIWHYITAQIIKINVNCAVNCYHSSITAFLKICMHAQIIIGIMSPHKRELRIYAECSSVGS